MRVWSGRGWATTRLWCAHDAVERAGAEAPYLLQALERGALARRSRRITDMSSHERCPSNVVKRKCWTSRLVWYSTADSCSSTIFRCSLAAASPRPLL